ncbi:hypothetical protein F503_01596 [Ophiostoma piceae UAMH 11346]|uniref:Uncharacterized protein n=1 Tax=Ophiostoma piceae (strain UAMH 11346) TaxID=1262450 RepID=S3CQE8_OPHP1|nr:hypothetical protein F503_01596 [Ophiostoma piceae UAMH 11346]
MRDVVWWSGIKRKSEELRVLRVGSAVIADNTAFPGAPDYVKDVINGGNGSPGSVQYSTRSYEADVVLQPRKAVPGFRPPSGVLNWPYSQYKIVEVSTIVSLRYA